MYEMELGKVRQKIQEISKDFDLRYKEELYRVMFLNSEEFVILQFLIGCPEPYYNKFGKRIQERVKNINEFQNSNTFLKYKKGFRGGSVLDYRDLKKFQYCINNLRDKNIIIKCNKILRKLKSFTNKTIVVITIPKTKKQQKFVLGIILFHEWIHILLFSNGIKQKKPKQWVLDEGLATYLQTYFEKKKSNISKILKQRIRKSKKDSLYKTYGKNALKFNNILKNKKDPTERKKAILDYYKKLKP
jgi:hypothetical protein